MFAPLRPVVMCVGLLLCVSVALQSFSPSLATAASSVETYVDPALADTATPSGPLKAGQLKLPKSQRDQQETSSPVAPQLPVGSLSAPQMPMAAPQSGQRAGSATAYQLMMGLRASLQKGGQNPDAPQSKSDLPQASVGEAPSAPQPMLAADTATQGASRYEAGRGPQNLTTTAAPASVSKPSPLAITGAEKPVLSPVAESASGAPVSLSDATAEASAPAAAPSVSTANTLKVPEVPAASTAAVLAQPSAPPAYVDLTATAAQVPAVAAPVPANAGLSPKGKKEKTKTATAASKKVSIFGAPVGAPAVTDEPVRAQVKDEAPVPEAASVAPVEPAEASLETLSSAALDAPCTAKVTEWVKDCAEAGYPSGYVGHLSGETRVACPGNVTKDVWLSNSCALPALIAKPDEQSKVEESKKTEEAKKAKDVDLAGAAKLAEEAAKAKAAELAEAAKLVEEAKKVEEGKKAEEAKKAKDTALAEEAKKEDEAKKLQEAELAEAAKLVEESKQVEAAKKAEEAKKTEEAKKAEAVRKAEEIRVAAEEAAAEEAHKAEDAAEKAEIIRKAEEEAAEKLALKKKEQEQTAAKVAAETSEKITTAQPAVASKGTSIFGAPVGASNAMPPKPVAGKCGAADTLGTPSKPDRDLCAGGVASAVSGKGPWTWVCQGENKGHATKCSAPLAKTKQVASAAKSLDAPKVVEAKPVAASVKTEDGVCGTSSGAGVAEAPSVNLCNKGTATEIRGDGPWTWGCAGLNGGRQASCAASLKIDGACGKANGKTTDDKPDSGLCAKGTAGVVDSSGGVWHWNCTGVSSGAVASCEAPRKQDAACGLADGKKFVSAPADELCATGKPLDVHARSSEWRWVCEGVNGGDETKCSADKLAEAKPVESQPVATPVVADPHQAEAKLVPNAAPASPVSSSSLAAPAAVASQAPVVQVPSVQTSVAKNGVACGEANGQAFADLPHMGLCADGKVTNVTGKGPWTWGCVSKKTKQQVACVAQLRRDGQCGSSNGMVLAAAPTARLCDSGSATTVTGKGPWIWTCDGVGIGSGSVSCSAGVQQLAKVDGVCGSSVNTPQSAIPSANLCASGKASAVNGDGPWNWSCSGMNGGAPSVCVAQRIATVAPQPPSPPVDANCGSANGVSTESAPRSGLCSAGSATNVTGDGPWNWSCMGSNGGMSVSCTAPLMPSAPVNGACGSANGQTTPVAPRSALCSGGISSAVSGKGPWTWTCSGVNGGSAVGCMAPIGSLKPTKSAPSAATPYYDNSPNSDLVPAETVQHKSSVLGGAGGLADAALTAGTLDPSLSIIAFAAGSEQLDGTGQKAAAQLASVLNVHKETRITLVASANTESGISPRDAKRLSLSRALVVRDALIAHGIASSRIDVRALGANVPGGQAADHVEVRMN